MLFRICPSGVTTGPWAGELPAATRGADFFAARLFSPGEKQWSPFWTKHSGMASIIIAALIIIAVYAGTKRLSGLQTVGVVTVTLVGILLAIFPDLSSRVATFLHVGRGTDLIFYLAVLVGLFVASNFYFRFKRQEELLIALTRQSAIDHASSPTVTAHSMPQSDRPVE